MATDKTDKNDKNPKSKKETEAQENTKKSAPAQSASPKTAKASAKTETSSPNKAAPKGTKREAVKRAPLAEKTYFAKVGEKGENWKIVDASGQPLGRLSSYIAMLLMGKLNPYYTPSTDTGDHVIVINAEKIVLTGKKLHDKMYHHHTNFPGGLKTFTARELLEKTPERLIEKAVWNMLPKNRGHLVRHWYGKLRVFSGTAHPHAAQKPQAVKLPDLGFWERT